jgi:hypothetical protein
MTRYFFFPFGAGFDIVASDEALADKKHLIVDGSWPDQEAFFRDVQRSHDGGEGCPGGIRQGVDGVPIVYEINHQAIELTDKLSSKA